MLGGGLGGGSEGGGASGKGGEGGGGESGCGGEGSGGGSGGGSDGGDGSDGGGEGHSCAHAFHSRSVASAAEGTAVVLEFHHTQWPVLGRGFLVNLQPGDWGLEIGSSQKKLHGVFGATAAAM